MRMSGEGILTSFITSATSGPMAPPRSPRWYLKASPTWEPIRSSGLSAVVGSWGMKAI